MPILAITAVITLFFLLKGSGLPKPTVAAPGVVPVATQYIADPNGSAQDLNNLRENLPPWSTPAQQDQLENTLQLQQFGAPVVTAPGSPVYGPVSAPSGAGGGSGSGSGGGQNNNASPTNPYNDINPSESVDQNGNINSSTNGV